MDATVIVIQSSEDNTHSISERLNDVGKQLAKLMYNSPHQSLNGKSVVVIFPQKRLARDEKVASNKEVIALQNSIKHIVRYATTHGINIQIKEHSEFE
jgi:hypothetical protein